MLFVCLMSSPVPDGSPVELGLCDDDVVHLRGGKHFKELVVVSLNDTSLFQLQFVALLYCLLDGGLISRFVPAQVLHLIPDGTLLLLHLPVEGEELGNLLGGELGFFGNKLLHVGLELLG